MKPPGVIISLREYAVLERGERSEALDPNGTRASLTPEAFDAVKRLVVAEPTNNGDDDLAPALRIVYEKRREVIRLGGVVGVIRAPDGTQLEVLPKQPDLEPGRSRALLLRMLASLPDMRFLLAPEALLDATRMPLSELIAAQFLRRAADLARRGIAGAYNVRELELTALRGKIDLPRQLRVNSTRPSRLQVYADEFDTDRAENRLIRLALERAATILWRLEHQRLLREVVSAFTEVRPSENITADWQCWSRDRSLRHYEALKPWVELVLRLLAPLGGVGNREAIAMLFPMHRVFEAFVAAQLGKQFPGCRVETQIHGEYLVRFEDRGRFALRPDLRLSQGGQSIIADTKWKTVQALDDVKQSDLYQLFAYAKKYRPDELWLIYPRHSRLVSPLGPLEFKPGLRLWILPFDLERVALALPEASAFSKLRMVDREVQERSSVLPIAPTSEPSPPYLEGPELDLFDPVWHPLVRALGSSNVSVEPGGDVLGGGQVIGSYLAEVALDTRRLRLIDGRETGLDALESVLQSEGWPAHRVQPGGGAQVALEIVRLLGEVG